MGKRQAELVPASKSWKRSWLPAEGPRRVGHSGNDRDRGQSVQRLKGRRFRSSL